jgi:hypothetical protein
MLDPEGQALGDELAALFAAGADATLEDHAFQGLARRVFRYNYQRVPAYAAYCRARGQDPDTVPHWTDIPAVPTAAFKDMVLLAEGAAVERVFRTSGTTRGHERRGEHHVADLSLYRAALRPTFEAFLLPDGARLPCFSLVPAAETTPDSSLAFMIDDVQRHFGQAGSGTFADLDGIDFGALDRAASAAVDTAQPVMLLGTSAAFIHWLDRLAAEGARHALPDGSRLMDTGGFKGGGRDVPPDALRQAYLDRLGLPPHRCVNEYGMTEMLSQLYDTSLYDHHHGRGEGRDRDSARCKGGPPWVRTVAVDPETLESLPPGRSGLLRHLDLANIGSVAAIQTEDVGRVEPDGVRVEGRAAGAPPRGCSIAMDLLLGGGA